MQSDTLNVLAKIPVFVNCRDQIFHFYTGVCQYQIGRTSIKTANGIAGLARQIIPSEQIEKLDKYVGAKVSYVALKYPIINKPSRILFDHSMIYCNTLYKNSLSRSRNFSLNVLIRVKKAAQTNILNLQKLLNKFKHDNHDILHILKTNSKTSIFVNVYIIGYSCIEDVTIFGYKIKDTLETILKTERIKIISLLLNLLTILENLVNRIEFHGTPTLKCNSENESKNRELLSELYIEIHNTTESSKKHASFDFGFSEDSKSLPASDGDCYEHVNSIEQHCSNKDLGHIRRLLDEEEIRFTNEQSYIMSEVQNNVNQKLNISPSNIEHLIPRVISDEEPLSSYVNNYAKPLITVLQSGDSNEIILPEKCEISLLSEDNETKTYKSDKICESFSDCKVKPLIDGENKSNQLSVESDDLEQSEEVCDVEKIQGFVGTAESIEVLTIKNLNSVDYKQQQENHENQNNILTLIDIDAETKDQQINKNPTEDYQMDSLVNDCNENLQNEKMKKELICDDIVSDKLPNEQKETNMTSLRSGNKMNELNFDNLTSKNTKIERNKCTSNKENTLREPTIFMKKRSQSCEVKKSLPVNYSNLPLTPQSKFVVPKLKNSHYSLLKKDSNSELFTSQEVVDKNTKRSRKHRKNTK